MPKYIAATEIRHGKPDGTRVIITEGDEVKGLDATTMKQLAEVGSIKEEVKEPVRREAPGEPSELEVALREQLVEAQEELARLRAQVGAQAAAKNPAK